MTEISDASADADRAVVNGVASVSALRASVPSAWQHTLEDGSFDHEWVTEFGVTFCAHCEVEKGE